MTIDSDGVEGGDTETVSLSAVDWQTNCAADSGAELRACNIITNGTAMDLTGESIKRSLGHRDYGMYGYDIKYNRSAANHDITIDIDNIATIVTDMIQVYLKHIHWAQNNTMVMTASDYVKSFRFCRYVRWSVW